MNSEFLDTLINYQIPGTIMLESEKRDIIQMFENLMSLANGKRDNEREYVFGADSDIWKGLSIWIVKMARWGWTQKKLFAMISVYSYEKKRWQNISFNQMFEMGTDLIDNQTHVADDVLLEWDKRKADFINGLSDIQKKYYQLLFIQGMSNVQVAEILGKSPTTVDHAKQKIKEELNKLKPYMPPESEDILPELIGYKETKSILDKAKKECPFCHSKDLYRTGASSKCLKCGLFFTNLEPKEEKTSR